MSTDPPIQGERHVAESGRELLSAVIADSVRQLTFGTLLYRLLYLVAAVVLFPLLVVIADHLVGGGLPRPVILGAGILWGLATILSAAGVSLRTTLRRLNRVFVARHVERSHRISHNPLINMVLLQQSREADYTRDIAVEQAASVLAESPTEAPGSSVSLRQPGTILLVTLGAWLLYSAITPKPILPSLARLFGADRAAPTATRLELARPRPDEPVYLGEPLELEFVVSGHAVTQVEFELLDPGNPEAAPLLRTPLRRSRRPGAGDRYGTSLAAHEVSADLHFRCSAGDAVLEGVIAVEPRADLLDLAIELVPPAYVGEPVRRTTDPDLRVWAGTQATFRARANTAVRDAVFVLRGATETRTRLSIDAAEPNRFSLTLPLTSSGEYWIEFSDLRGRPCCDPTTHRIVVRHDAAPQVEITAPSEDEAPGDVVDVTHTAWLRARASDDVLLDEVSLVTDAGGTVSRRNLLESEAVQPGRRIEVGVATSDLPLQTGESIRVWFEARDSRVLRDGTPAPQLGASRELRLVRSPEVAPPPSVEDPVPQTDLADATGTSKETKQRRRSGAGGEGDTGDAVDEAGAGRGGPDAPGGTYQRSPGAGGGEDVGEDEQEPGTLDPDDVEEIVEPDESDDEARDDGQSGAQAGESGDADEKFREELREFDEKHGNEAREVNERLGQQGEGEESADARSGESGAGVGDGGQGGASAKDGEADDDTKPGADEEPSADEKAETQPGDAAEDASTPPTDSQPSAQQPPDSKDPSDGESEAPDRESSRESGDESSRPEPTASQEAEKGREPAAEAESKGEQAKPDSQETDRSSDRQDSGEQAEGERNPPPSEPKEADGAAEQPGKQNQQPEDQKPPASDAASEKPAEGEDVQPTPSEKPEQSAKGGGQPEQPAGEAVIPMSGQAGAPATEPPAEPSAPAETESGEVPGDSGQRTEATDTIALLQRAEDLTEDDLIELGWPPAQRQAFIRDFERLREVARRAGALSQLKQWRTRLELGSGDVASGSGLSREVATGVAGGNAVRDGLEQIAPPAEQRVAPELRGLLEAYYRSLAEQRARGDEASAPTTP